MDVYIYILIYIYIKIYIYIDNDRQRQMEINMARYGWIQIALDRYRYMQKDVINIGRNRYIDIFM